MAQDVWETERLRLRRFTLDDVELIYELDSDPAVMRFITGGTATPRDRIEGEILPRFLRTSAGHPGFGFWAVEEKSTGTFLGCLCFRPANGSGPAEIELGYRFRRAAWGQGFAAEGARMLIDRGFTEWGVQRVHATAYEDNLASSRVMEKVGLTYVRSFRFALPEATSSTYSAVPTALFAGDDVEYALTRADWARQTSTRREHP